MTRINALITFIKVLFLKKRVLLVPSVVLDKTLEITRLGYYGDRASIRSAVIAITKKKEKNKALGLYKLKVDHSSDQP